MTTVQQTKSASELFAALNGAGSNSSSTTSSTEEAQNQFLTLLTTQLTNQDPLNPMDNAEMTSQLAQMSTVSGIEKLNSTLSSLVESLANSQAMQASDMIGKAVLVPGTNLTLSDGAAYGGVKLSSAASQVTISILDSAGNVVQTENLGAHDAGSFTFAWDGTTSDGTKVPAGAYKFKVEAVKGTTAVTADALQVGTVSAVVRSSGGFVLDLGALGTTDFSNVQQIL